MIELFELDTFIANTKKIKWRNKIPYVSVTIK